MRVLGLDLATVSGWAHVELRGSEWIPIRWGVIDCTPASSDQPEGIRFLKLMDALPPILEGVDAIAIEQTFVDPKKKRAAEVLNGLIAIALAQIERVGCDYIFVPPATWKKQVVGKRPKMPKGQGLGQVKKHEVRSALNGWAGVIEPGTSLKEDEADALGVAKWFVETHGQKMMPDLKF